MSWGIIRSLKVDSLPELIYSQYPITQMWYTEDVPPDLYSVWETQRWGPNTPHPKVQVTPVPNEQMQSILNSISYSYWAHATQKFGLALVAEHTHPKGNVTYHHISNDVLPLGFYHRVGQVGIPKLMFDFSEKGSHAVVIYADFVGADNYVTSYCIGARYAIMSSGPAEQPPEPPEHPEVKPEIKSENGTTSSSRFPWWLLALLGAAGYAMSREK